MYTRRQMLRRRRRRRWRWRWRRLSAVCFTVVFASTVFAEVILVSDTHRRLILRRCCLHCDCTCPAAMLCGSSILEAQETP